MSERRRLRAGAPPTPARDDAFPECLAVGACIEVWDAQGRSGITAWRRHRDAVRRWREDHGLRHEELPPALRSGSPWSYDYLTAEPDRLAQRLRAYGLPPDWSPSPAPVEWLVPTATTTGRTTKDGHLNAPGVHRGA